MNQQQDGLPTQEAVNRMAAVIIERPPATMVVDHLTEHAYQSETEARRAMAILLRKSADAFEAGGDDGALELEEVGEINSKCPHFLTLGTMAQKARGEGLTLITFSTSHGVDLTKQEEASIFGLFSFAMGRPAFHAELNRSLEEAGVLVGGKRITREHSDKILLAAHEALTQQEAEKLAEDQPEGDQP